MSSSEELQIRNAEPECEPSASKIPAAKPRNQDRLGMAGQAMMSRTA